MLSMQSRCPIHPTSLPQGPQYIQSLSLLRRGEFPIGKMFLVSVAGNDFGQVLRRLDRAKGVLRVKHQIGQRFIVFLFAVFLKDLRQVKLRQGAEHFGGGGR